ncbi:MAG: hypothetical protein ACLQGP_10060 [Isosphaeraceae bacterium]
MILPGETRRLRTRFFVSGISLLGFGLSLGSIGLISGCDDGKSTMTQVENPENPAEKAKDSMNFYKTEKMKNATGKKK